MSNYLFKVRKQNKPISRIRLNKANYEQNNYSKQNNYLINRNKIPLGIQQLKVCKFNNKYKQTYAIKLLNIQTLNKQHQGTVTFYFHKILTRTPMLVQKYSKVVTVE